jgi:acyl-CoA synthetase (AMP-forming)/AMP-acid ligase II/acyl carrier protein
MLSQLANLDQQGWDHTPDSVMVSWVPIFHDLGLVYGMLQPLWGGFACYLMTPQDFVKRPMRWLEAISRYRGTHTGAPNFGFDLCVRKSTPEERRRLDLRSWRVALNGSEPVRPKTVEQFAAAFEGAGFDPHTMCPAFGLAEATAKVTTKHRDEPFRLLDLVAEDLERGVITAAREGPTALTTDLTADLTGRLCRLTSNGIPSLDSRVLIADPEKRVRLGENEVGEVWVRGSIVSPGYWRRPEETAETFQAHLADGEDGPSLQTPDLRTPYLRTGDLGFLRDGELYITGRLKDVIIIRGRNHYPQDLESTAGECHPALRPGCAAAYPVELDSEERLGISLEVRREWEDRFDLGEVVDAIVSAVAEQHELELSAVSFLRAGEIPKTSSGKIMRRACRQAFEGWLAARGIPDAPAPALGLWVAAARSDATADAPSPPPPRQAEIRTWLLAWVAARRGVEPSAIGAGRPFASFGLDSGALVSLAGELETWLGRSLPAAIAYDHPSVERLARHLAGESTQAEGGARRESSS